MKTAMTVVVLSGVAAALFIPFDRYVSVQGATMLYETRFVEAPEAGILTISAQSLDLENQELQQRADETALQQVKLENLRRASFASADQQAGLAAELESYKNIEDQLRTRLAGLRLSMGDAARQTWSLRSARVRQGSWLDPSMGHILGAVSDPTKPYLSLRLAQNDLTSELEFGPGTFVQARLKKDPECEINTKVDTQQSSVVALDDVVQVRALIDVNEMNCDADLIHGAPVVARFYAGQASMVDRFWLYAARILQDRLLLNAE